MTKDQRPFQWEEGEFTVTRTTRWSGPGCHDGCGVLYYTKGNKLVKVEGDKESPFYNGRLCPRCLNLPEAVHHRDRLLYPLKRIGKRGENRWERISWDDAYDLIETKVREAQKDYGPESIVCMVGTGRNVWGIVPKLTYSAFESPNFATGFLSGDACYLPRAALMGTMTGDFQIIDAGQVYEEGIDSPRYQIPKCIMIWGNNPIVSNPDGFMGHWIVDLMKRGTKLIVVDPRVTWLASRADYHLPLRPGTDSALALGMMNVIINEGLCDAEFIDKWTYGFSQLKERVQQFPPERVAEITWVPKDKIIQAARFYALSKPASIQWGLAIDMAPDGVTAAHAIASLWTITGNVDNPGGNIIVRGAYNAPIASAASGWGWDELPEDVRAKRIGYKEYPLYKMGFCATSHADTVLKACESGKPYPVRILWLQSTNPIANMASEAKRVHDAMLKVPFNVVVDLFMTPTAVAAADLVLPVASSPERDSLRAWWTPLRSISKVISMGEVKTDEEIVFDIGKRLNPKQFPWEDVKDMLTWCIRESGLTFGELEKRIYIYPEFQYEKYAKGLLRPDGKPGFNTPTGRIELYLTNFDNWNVGLDPLPYYKEPIESPVSTPELYKEYPLVLTTGARSWVYFHSENRQQPSAREFHPYPVVQINPETADRYGIQNGDWIWIENRHGKCRQKAEVTPIIPSKIVHGEHGWWYPEKKAEEPSLYGVWESNINLLTTQCDNGPSGYGGPYKTQLCKIYKAEEGGV